MSDDLSALDAVAGPWRAVGARSAGVVRPRLSIGHLVTRPRTIWSVLFIVLLVLVPAFFNDQVVGVANLILLATVGAVALNMLQGVAGQLSVGNAAFMAVGAFTTGELTVHLQTPFLVSLLASGAVGGVLGILVGFPALRVRGLYLLLATLAFQYVVAYVAQVIQTAGPGPAGFTIPEATIGSIQIATTRQWYTTWAIAASIALFLMANVRATKLGRAWMAIRASETMAGAMGINVARSVIGAFGITGVIVGIQGALFAYYVTVVQFDSFPLALAIQYLAMVLIGGEGSVAGPLVGAIVVQASGYVLSQILVGGGFIAQHTADLQQIIYGALIIIVLIVEPHGLVGIGHRVQALVARRIRRSTSQERSADGQ